MARRLPTWHWIRVVRARGPTVPTIRAVLYALAVRMDDNGEAFPSQRTIATDTALGERTVRDAILEARRMGWLAVVDHVRPGQSWRLSHYIACVPNGLNLADVNVGRDVDLERMSDVVGSEHGDVDDRMHGLPRRARGAGPRTAKGAAAIAARSKGEKAKVRQLTQKGAATGAEGAATIAGKVRQPSPTKFPSKFPSKFPKKGRIASDAPDRVKDTGNQKPEHGTQPDQAAGKPNGNGNRIVPSEVLQGFGPLGTLDRPRGRRNGFPSGRPVDPKEAEPRIRKLILTLPHLSDGEVAKILGADPSAVRNIRHSMERVA